jgi:transcriptional regulator with XRE-family HTH domain
VNGGSLVEEARRRSGLTQSELGRRLGVPQSTVARWETKRTAPSFENVLRAVRACDLDLSLRVVERDEELVHLIGVYAGMTPAERLAQNVHLVNLVDSARHRMAAARE